ncbi:MAG: hypothetical protein D4R41_00670 [Sediminibacterium sp.]|nr:MAG: hypothetical protein D4R41_00670 [Sediminibacterium sp.]
MNQRQMVSTYLLTGATITPLEALRKFGSLRLASIIFDLRADGLNIQSENVNVGTKKKAKYVAKYFIPKKVK